MISASLLPLLLLLLLLPLLWQLRPVSRSWEEPQWRFLVDGLSGVAGVDTPLRFLIDEDTGAGWFTWTIQGTGRAIRAVEASQARLLRRCPIDCAWCRTRSYRGCHSGLECWHTVKDYVFPPQPMITGDTLTLIVTFKGLPCDSSL